MAHRNISKLGKWCCAAFVLGLILTACFAPVVGAKLIIQQRGFVQPAINTATGTNANDASSSAEYPNAAPLPTDSEVDRVLKRADEYVKQERFDLAAEVWQKVLDSDSSVVRTKDGRLFRSVQVYIEEQLAHIARTNPVGLREYRIKADAEATSILAQAKRETEAASSGSTNAATNVNAEDKLAEVVRRFFFSSLGDDAAYELGCLMLDRFEFVAAARLFNKVLTYHPDYIGDTGTPPSYAREDVLLRLAIANARTGDAKTAKLNLDEISQIGNARIPREVLAAVRRDVADGEQTNQTIAGKAGSWPMAYGNVARDGQMPGLKDANHQRADWDALWISRYSDKFGLTGSGASSPNSRPVTRSSLHQKWAEQQLLPTSQLLLGNGYVYYRSYNKVVCIHGKTGKLRWNPIAAEVPRVQVYTSGNYASAEEVILFADQVNSSLSIHDGVLYFFEDDNSSALSSRTSLVRHRGIMAYRPRYANKLVAVNVATGKRIWEASGVVDDNGNKPAVRYHGAPVAHGGVLLLPVYDNGSLWIYARYADPSRKGKLAWKTELCGEPRGGSPAWSTTGIAVAGGDVYVASGSGVVFNVDISGGQIRWAVRYKRDVKTSGRPGYSSSTQSKKGFYEDFIVAYGKHLVILPTDADELFSLDRRSGKILWRSSRGDATHCVGLRGRNLYVAGKDFLRRYDVPTGKLVRENDDLLANGEATVTGKGFVSDDAVYLPIGASIARLDPIEINKKLSRVQVNLPIRDSNSLDYVGNIYSDGKHIYGIGLERVYALLHRKKEPTQGVPDSTDKITLDQNHGGTIAAGDDAEMLASLGVKTTTESLGKFLDEMHPSKEMNQRVAALVELLGDASFAKREKAKRDLLAMPLVPLEALEKAKDGDDPERQLRATQVLDASAGKQTSLLLAALKSISKHNVKGLAPKVLSIVPLCSQQYLLNAARDALAATAQAQDEALLRKAVNHESAKMRLVSIAGLGTGLGEKAVDDLRVLFRDEDPRVQLAAARSLANIGNRDSLNMLTELLIADDLNTRLGAVQTLRNLTKQRFNFVPYEEDRMRSLAIAQWRKWVVDNGKSAKLYFPLKSSRFLLGRTIICNYRTNRVYELDAQGKEVWSIKVTNPWGCQGLPNGHRLVTSYSSRNVTEYDNNGKIVWQKNNLPSAPFSVYRLDSGNTLIACSNSNKVIEFDRSGKTVWDITINGRPTNAQRLSNGRTLVTLQNSNRAVEIDRSGKVLWSLDNIRNPLSATRLPNGNTLVAEVGGQMIREFDPAKKQVWSSADVKQTLKSPYHAERLENGNTLMCDYTSIREVTPAGKVIWEKRESGISRFHRY